MDKSHNDFFDLEEVEVLAKRKLPKPVGFTGVSTSFCFIKSRLIMSVLVISIHRIPKRDDMPGMQVYDYYAGGADTESTVRDNRTVYGRYRLLPRYMVDVSHCDLTYQLLGKFPLAPQSKVFAGHTVYMLLELIIL